MITRVLFIDSDAEALARVKHAVEQAGDYEAKVFMTAQAALEDAAQNPPTVIVIAMNVQDIPPQALAQQFHAIYPQVPLLLRVGKDMPYQEVDSIPHFGKITGRYSSRQLIPMLAEAIAYTNAPFENADEQDWQIQPVGSFGDDMAAFGEVLESISPDSAPAKEDSFNILVESMAGTRQQARLPKRHERIANWAQVSEDEKEDQSTPTIEQDETFQKLAAEEPPMPTLEDTGTIKDLIAITDFDENDDDLVVDIPDDMIEDIDQLPLNTNEQALLDRIARAQLEEEEEPDPSNLEIDFDELDRRIEAHLEVEQDETPAEKEVPEPATMDPAIENEPFIEDIHPIITALELTQQTIESAAQSSIIMFDNEVLAAVGALPESDVMEIASCIDTEDVLAAGTTKIKFIGVTESNLNYMVVLTPTIDAMVLLTVFPENMHLRIIRRQTQNILAKLLESVENTLVETEEPPVVAEPYSALPVVEESELQPSPVNEAQETVVDESTEETTDEDEIDPATLVKYACAWILRDPTSILDDDIIALLQDVLPDIIHEKRWLMDELDLQPDYVSVVVAVPTNEAPSELVQSLMNESESAIINNNPGYIPMVDDTQDPERPASLWADAYYVIAPGRPLTQDEIRRFISFQRET